MRITEFDKKKLLKRRQLDLKCDFLNIVSRYSTKQFKVRYKIGYQSRFCICNDSGHLIPL